MGKAWGRDGERQERKFMQKLILRASRFQICWNFVRRPQERKIVARCRKPPNCNTPLKRPKKS